MAFSSSIKSPSLNVILKHLSLANKLYAEIFKITFSPPSVNGARPQSSSYITVLVKKNKKGNKNYNWHTIFTFHNGFTHVTLMQINNTFRIYKWQKRLTTRTQHWQIFSGGEQLHWLSNISEHFQNKKKHCLHTSVDSCNAGMQSFTSFNHSAVVRRQALHLNTMQI